MLYILEEFVEDMRFYKAGTVLKDPDGPARAFALHIWGIRYSRMHLTDGFLPFASAHACGLVQAPQDVAEALCSRTVKLWKRMRGGYLITTYKDNNPTASRIKKLRAAARLRKQEERDRKRKESPRDTGPSRRRGRAANEPGTRSQLAANVQPMCAGDAGSFEIDPHERPLSVEMSQRDRCVTEGVTRTQYQYPSTSTQSTQLQLLPPVVVQKPVEEKFTSADAPARTLEGEEPKALIRSDLQTPGFDQLCIMAHHVFDRLGPDANPSEATDALKWDCASARFTYSTLALSSAVEAARVARRKGYRTPPIRQAVGGAS